jgi:hypothetical protein
LDLEKVDARSRDRRVGVDAERKGEFDGLGRCLGRRRDSGIVLQILWTSDSEDVFTSRVVSCRRVVALEPTHVPPESMG